MGGIGSSDEKVVVPGARGPVARNGIDSLKERKELLEDAGLSNILCRHQSMHSIWFITATL